jgi:hypothetical protein
MQRQDIITYLTNMRDFRPSYSKEQYQEYLESFDTETLKDKLDRQQAWNTYKHDAELVEDKYLKVGAVIKIDTLELQGRDYYNYWGVVLKVNKETKTKRATVEVFIESGTKCNLAVANIKSIIGTKDLDIVGIGYKRHKNEVVKLITKAFKNN